MHPDRREELRKRVVSAAEAALAHHQYVSAIDVLTRTGLLAATNVESWRKGRIDFLERGIPANLKKISESMAIFRRWALEKVSSPAKRATCAGRAAELWTCNSARAAIPPSRRTIARNMFPRPCPNVNKSGSHKN